MKKIISIFFIILLAAFSAHAQDAAPVPDDAVEITADEAIEWLRDENMYRARGNAKAIQKGTSVEAETLSAFYDPESSKTIKEIHADGEVTITNGQTKATGGKAIYQIQNRIATLSGGNLSVTAPNMKVTASDRLEYFANAQKAVAIGNATASDGTNTIKSAQLSAWVSQNKTTGKNTLKRVEATGGVRIETPTDIIFGDKGTYDAVAETATVEGNVRITRDDNQLNGDRAVVNLKTGVSQLFAAPNTSGKTNGGRVRALFYPGQDATHLESVQ